MSASDPADAADAADATAPTSEADAASSPARDGPPDWTTDALRLAWREHRPYVGFSVALFCLGILAGIAIYQADIDLFAAMGLESFGDLLPEDPTATFVFLNNTRVFFIFIFGALTGGLLTLVGLLFNGVIVGYVASLAAAQAGIGFVLLALAPHGILELPALFVASAVGFRVIGVVVNYVLDRRDELWTRAEVKRTLLLVLVAWVALGVAAVVEMHVTTWLLEQVFGGAGAA
ncbi:stage II sporulation protein M [Haloarchaeobius amylolyticus]|uniref:stage II sporulation protein M n=1 Tax=Haloarchaeobius amylolyticus TaxID=1198296 RepID=UPI00226E7608|nr:stage II sporulation protein M [Haloarchaeobius amylolyticus]